MKIALVSSFVPFIHGGTRNIVEWLQTMLEMDGHSVERVYFPQSDRSDSLFPQMMIYRWVDLSAADRIVCFQPHTHLIPHHHKIVWLVSHIPGFYDLWDHLGRSFSHNLKDYSLRDTLQKIDHAGLMEAKTIFSNSRSTLNRLARYNNINSEVLYPPLSQPQRFYCADFSEEILCIYQSKHHHRLHLLIEAMQYVKTPVQLTLISSETDYLHDLQQKITAQKLPVHLKTHGISEEEKIQHLSHCLALAYLPVDADSYPYPSIEASYASKPTLTTSDSGTVLEFIEDGINGYVVAPDPIAVADAMDRLYLDRNRTVQMGKNARERLRHLNISWEHVLQKLLI